MRRERILLSSFFCVLVLCGCRTFQRFERSDALWKIVSQSCIPNEKANGNPAPCEKVVLAPRPGDGFVVLKDRRGSLQYLLMPTEKITGVESPEILKPDSANYFYDAWLSRIYMSERRGRPVDDTQIALTVNSKYGRTQNQLHIHISCVRSDVRKAVQLIQGQLTERWAPVPESLFEHNYFVRFLSEAEFRAKSPFVIVKEELLAPNEPLDAYGIAMVPIPGNGNVNFALLVDKADATTGDRGSAEELQDHTCAALN